MAKLTAWLWIQARVSAEMSNCPNAFSAPYPGITAKPLSCTGVEDLLAFDRSEVSSTRDIPFNLSLYLNGVRKRNV